MRPALVLAALLAGCTCTRSADKVAEQARLDGADDGYAAGQSDGAFCATAEEASFVLSPCEERGCDACEPDDYDMPYTLAWTTDYLTGYRGAASEDCTPWFDLAGG